MTKKDETRLRKAIEGILWMAIRYADGRHTYAPYMVRDSVRVFKDVFPNFKVKHDAIIEPPKEGDLTGMSLRSDYLYDLMDEL